ncbi:MAG: hypothetical protein K2Z80_15665 [Xanthobacteraceae bacterium]|nr:hypothetical protein [Xanthobacteraceae bacterium]
MTHILSGLLNGLSDAVVAGDQYTYVDLAAAARAVISYRTAKRDTENTLEFIHDLRERVIGAPEINTDGFHPYKAAIRDVLAGRVSHGVIAKTYSVTNLAVKEAARRYSPAEVVAVEREVVSGLPANISTSYVERSNLTLRSSACRQSVSRASATALAGGWRTTARRSRCTSCTTISATCMRAFAARPRWRLAWLSGYGQISDLVDAALAT